MFRSKGFILRYSNCWEDTDYLINHLSPFSPKKILSICSGGENSLSLLSLNPEKVVVVDINPFQLFLFEFKLAAIKTYNLQDCKKFLGFEEDEHRQEKYRQIRETLSWEAREYWDGNPSLVANGVIHSGYLEKNLQLFGKWFRALIHNSKSCKKLFSEMDAKERNQYFESSWNSKSWNLLFSIFFSKLSLRIIGPDSSFFHFNDGNVKEHMRERVNGLMNNTNCSTNYMLHYALFGNFGNLLPHYMRSENFKIIKSNLDRLFIYKGYVESTKDLKHCYSAFNLSNIFDYNTDVEMREIGRDLYELGADNAVYFYWNILRSRKLSNYSSDRYKCIRDTANIQEDDDRGLVYMKSVIDMKVH